jgi:hypothetical protein
VWANAFSRERSSCGASCNKEATSVADKQQNILFIHEREREREREIDRDREV